MERQEHNWGYELILWKDKNFTVKLIHIDYNCETELHKHLYKREIVIDEGFNSYTVEPGQFHILTCDKNRDYVEFVEVSKRESSFDYVKADFIENNKENT